MQGEGRGRLSEVGCEKLTLRSKLCRPRNSNASHNTLGAAIAGSIAEVAKMRKNHSLTVVIKLGILAPAIKFLWLLFHRRPANQRFSWIGTSSIVDEKTHEPLLSILSVIVETAVKLQYEGHKVVLVSSGAIGVGLRRMKLDRRPKHLPKTQALAAIGQCRLMSLWDQLFGHMRQPVAQILLTRNDIADRTQYLNAQNTLSALMEMGVIPIVNENDTISVAEIKFGDNDTLSAITAGMVHADYLFLMTDVDCLYDKNPRTNPDAKPITLVKDISELQADVSSRGSALGTGGMSTKIVAARLATSAGVTTIITRSSRPGNIRDIIKYAESQRVLSNGSSNGSPASTPLRTSIDKQADRVTALSLSNSQDFIPEGGAAIPRTSSPSPVPLPSPPLHTRFVPDPHPIRDRYFWLLHGLAPHGDIYIDEGAYHALADKAGLLPVGIVDVDGTFAQQEAVRLFVVRRIKDPKTGTMSYEKMPDQLAGGVGKALVNYSSTEIKRIKGLYATEISNVLGYADSEYVALRENIAFYPERSRPVTPTLESGPALGDAGTPSRAQFPLPA
jgi:glutamate 5-kinase